MIFGIWSSRIRSRVTVSYAALNFCISVFVDSLLVRRYPSLPNEAGMPFLRDIDSETITLGVAKETSGDTQASFTWLCLARVAAFY